MTHCFFVLNFVLYFTFYLVLFTFFIIAGQQCLDNEAMDVFERTPQVGGGGKGTNAISTNGFQHAFQSANFTVEEFLNNCLLFGGDRIAV